MISSMTTLQHLLAFLGRVAIAAIFVWSGAQHILAWDGFLLAIAGKIPQAPLAGVAADAQSVALVMAILAVVALVGGGLLLALGLRARWGAAVLLAFLVPTTILFHDFWALDPALPEYRDQATAFLKNVGLAGGLLMVLAFDGGAIGADGLFPDD